MKTLQEIKNQYAQEQGYADWADLYRRAGYYDEMEFFKHENEVIVRAQKAALEKAAEKSLLLIKLPTGDSRTQETAYLPERDINIIVDRTSITNPENLIR